MGVRGKGLGNKIDPTKGSMSPSFVSITNDRTITLSDEIMLRILGFIVGDEEEEEEDPSPCFLVCKRWSRLRGLLKTSIRVKEWSFLESGHMVRRFPNLTDVDLSGAWLLSPPPPSKKQSNKIIFTHHFITVHLEPNAYDPISIEKFIEGQQIPPESLDKGLRVLADGCPCLQRLCLIDVRRPSYNSLSINANEALVASHEKTLPLIDQRRSNDLSLDDKDVKKSPLLNNGVGEDIKPIHNSFNEDSFSKGGLAYLAMKCPTLQELVLNQCTDESLYAISSCQNLQILRLVGSVCGFYHCTFTDIGLTILAKGCRRLVKLELSGCEASYDGIAAIGQCCFMLEELTLSNQGFYEGWMAALSYCSCLKTLRLEGCKQLDPVPGPAEHLYSCPALQRLELVRCNLRDTPGFAALMAIAVTIRELLFQDCWGLDDDTFKLADMCRQVRFLSLEGCALLTTGGIEAVVVTWKDLHTLQVSSCDSVKDSEISPALATVFSILKVLKWRPDTKSLLTESLAGSGVGQIGGKFFKRGQ